jgi:type VI secretion system protein ImpE
MNPVQAAERAIREGSVDEALQLLQSAVRASPGDAALRIFLFQLLAVQGQWERSLNQLNVAAELDAGALAMAQMYRETLHCEALRADVFAGRRSPVIFGQPDDWLALLIESLLTAGQGRPDAAEALRQRAFEAAPASAGSIDGQAFSWIADADMRLGPVCEAVINGRYYWLPFARLSRVVIDKPEDLRDTVWMPAHFMFTNDPLVRLSRRTEWVEAPAGVFSGLGQRVLATDVGEFPLMDVREILIAPAADSGE